MCEPPFCNLFQVELTELLFPYRDQTIQMLLTCLSDLPKEEYGVCIDSIVTCFSKGNSWSPTPQKKPTVGFLGICFFSLFFLPNLVSLVSKPSNVNGTKKQIRVPSRRSSSSHCQKRVSQKLRTDNLRYFELFSRGLGKDMRSFCRLRFLM